MKRIFLKRIHVLYLILFVIMGVSFTSCVDDDDEVVYAPRPRGYFRIDFPEKTYRMYDSICPYAFEIPIYSFIDQDKHLGADPCWLNVNFPKYKAQLHLSYKEINHNLQTYLEDSRDFAVKHQIKATGLDETPVIRDSARVYGLVYDIAGNTASSVQFYVTDSTKHFVRGALYFNTVPNIDSLKIVIDYLRGDIIHMIKTFRWKDGVIPKK